MPVKNSLRHLLVAAALLATGEAFSQSGWTKKLFDQNVFIENKGQFDGKTERPETVRFGAAREGVQMYFTTGGITYRHDAYAPMKEREIKAAEKGRAPHAETAEEKEEERERWTKAVPAFLSLEWLNADPSAEFLAQDPASFYHTYGDAPAIKAQAYRKLVCKSIYPNIDVEYFLPSDSGGLKYSLILHPGADPSLIKLRYRHAKAISIDREGNLQIKSAFGKLIDHAPLTFYSATKTPVRSAFVLHGNTVSFQLDAYDPTQELIIDPWTTVPTFTGYNAAYDVNYDLNGNVYVYGSASPFQLMKLDNSGAIQWIFNATGMNGNIYGDFAVDELSGTSYIMEGWSFAGVKVYKVTTFGVSAGTLPANINLNEMWRAEFNQCVGEIVIAAGGTGANVQAYTLDTNLTTLTQANVLSATNAFHDMVLLALDNTNNFCYMATATSTFAPANFDNVLVKCPLPALTPPVFMVPDGHKFMEQGSATYINGTGFGAANGINGMAVSPGWLYTYDSDSLKRWDKNTGAFSLGIDVSPLPPNISGTSIQVNWGGLTTDECGNVYAGLFNSIVQFDTALVPVATFPLPDTVYDVRMGLNGKLYACGKNFVAQIDLSPGGGTLNVTEVSPACNLCDGVATVNSISSASCAASPSFTYAWSTNPVQTTQTATGLCPGIYTVTLTAGCHSTFTGTVQITSAAGPAVNLGNDTAVCGTPAILLDAGPNGTYVWSNGDTTQTIVATSPGTYWVTVSNNGCSATDTIVILTVASPSLGNDTSLCTGQTLTLNAAPGASYQWSTGATTQNISVSASGQYWVNVSSGSCTLSDTINVAFTQFPDPVLPDTTLCPNDTLVLDAGIADSYQWSTGATTQTISVSSAGTYSVLAVNEQCPTADTAIVTILPPLTLEKNISLCDAESFVLEAGSTNASYTWSTGATTPAITITQGGTYWVSVTSGGCTLSDTTHINGELAGGVLYVPNTFTPNENGLNDFFTGHGADITYFKMQIFDRWGELIFETEKQYPGWDGTYKSELVQEDIYVWRIEYKTGCTKDELLHRIGHVGVIR